MARLTDDLKVLYHLVKPVRGETQAERLENFYEGQADLYDSFRERLLQGRQALFEAAAARTGEGKVWVDLGAGTGHNLEFVRPWVSLCKKVILVDLCPSLLGVARGRVERYGWTNVEVREGDATTFCPGELVDLVTCSYSLTMVEDWFRAVDQAYDCLAEGGHLASVDFYVSRKFPAHGLARHGWFTREFWPAYFAVDNVFLSPDHLPYLRTRFETVTLEEQLAKLPYIPVGKVPYYRFIGQKVGQPS